MKTDDFERAPGEPGPAGSPDEAAMRELFRRTAPTSRPLDVDRLLLTASRPPRNEEDGRPGGSLATWKAIAAAVLILAVGGGAGWTAARIEARREASHLERTVTTELESLRRELSEKLTRAVERDHDELVVAQREGMKQLAILLRNDYRRLLARVRAEMRGLSLTDPQPRRGYANISFEPDAQER